MKSLDLVFGFFAILGAAVAVYIGLLALKHGWGWVLAQGRAFRAGLEARAKAKAEAALAPFEGRFKAIEADIAAMKPKLGL